ncbi:MAG: hypothetical protein ACO1SV_10320 [Fimbriimonas sp.]
METAVGRFKKGPRGWYGFASDGRFQLRVWDRDGVPDPEFVRGLPDIFAALPEFEGRARAFEPELTHRGFELGGLIQRTVDGEWTLLFEKYLSRDPLIWTIEFVAGQPVRSVEGGSGGVK